MSTARTTLRDPLPGEEPLLQTIWEVSLHQDDPGGWPRGGWALAAWATAARVLAIGGAAVGVAALRFPAGSESADARVVLLPEWRDPASAAQLVQAVLALAGEQGALLLRLFVPARADWALEPARAAGMRWVRTIYHMLRPAEATRFTAPPVPGLRVRPLRPGEEPALLEALNRGWAGSWNFHPITAEMLARDLQGQREGMLLGVEEADERHIVATCHAIFDPRDRNPDGGPRAWISNLTTLPAWRGRGVARQMLAAGLDSLRARGAGSVTLGVDAGTEAALALYRAAGFEVISALQVWEWEARR